MLSVGWLYGQEMPIPSDLQAPIFKKILTYDRALQGRSDIVVYLVGSESEQSSMQTLADAFRAVGLVPEIVNSGTLDGNASPSSVVYMMSGADKEQVAGYCAEKKILTISGVAPFAEQGHVAISIGEKGGRPLIIVNLPRLKVEGHELSSDVLKLAKVIK
jgi:hypothetical protein